MARWGLRDLFGSLRTNGKRSHSDNGGEGARTLTPEEELDARIDKLLKMSDEMPPKEEVLAAIRSMSDEEAGAFLAKHPEWDPANVARRFATTEPSP